MNEIYAEWTDMFTCNIHKKWNISWRMENRIDNRIYERYDEVCYDMKLITDLFLLENLL